jgi:hypothetical protein
MLNASNNPFTQIVVMLSVIILNVVRLSFAVPSQISEKNWLLFLLFCCTISGKKRSIFLRHFPTHSCLVNRTNSINIHVYLSGIYTSKMFCKNESKTAADCDTQKTIFYLPCHLGQHDTHCLLHVVIV